MAIELSGFFAPVYGKEISLEKKDFSTMVALIDADRYKHLVTYRIYQKIMNEGYSRSDIRLSDIIEEYLSRDVFEQFSAKGYIFCFSASSSKVFRNHVAQEKEYKGNRKRTADPNYYNGKYEDMAAVFEYIKERYSCLYYDTLEADDIVSFLQDPERTFIFSHDKDLKQVEGFHYNMETRTLNYTSEEEGMKLLISQILLGDSTDNFLGLPRFGKKALEKFKEEHNDKPVQLWLNLAIKNFIDKFGVLKGTDMFVEMWNIASMKINRGDYFKEKYSDAFMLLNKILEE